MAETMPGLPATEAERRARWAELFRQQRQRLGEQHAENQRLRCLIRRASATARDGRLGETLAILEEEPGGSLLRIAACHVWRVTV
jgi:hypothetical protein